MTLRQIFIALAFVSAVFLGLQVWMLSGQPAAPAAAPSDAGADAGQARKPVAPPLRILMAGNSYLSRNDLPAMLRQLALAAGRPAPRIELLAPGAATLEQHLSNGELSAQLADGPWDYLVLQEQSQRASFAPQQREQQMYAPARALDTAAKAAGAKTVLLMTWARREGDADNVADDTYKAMQRRVAAGYLQLGNELGAAVAKVGLAWRNALALRRDIALWTADGSHPTRAGTYLAACVLYGTLYDADPRGNSFRGGLSKDEAEFLQRMAARVTDESQAEAQP